jgi:hypothetical protein
MKHFLFPALATSLLLTGCDLPQPVAPQSASGVTKASTVVQTGTDGLTIEQRNIRDRLKTDNLPGSIKHLYVISPLSGDVLIYSTVRGKVTSGGKRLTPKSVWAGYTPGGSDRGFDVDIGGATRLTSEVLQDDGTYGDSSEYLYWWDVQGRYHQQFVGSSAIIHVSDNPLPVRSVKLNLEVLQ